MRLKEIIGLVLAVVIAVVAAYYTQRLLQKENHPVEVVKESEENLQQVIVAAKQLHKGERIDPGDVVFQSWPTASLSDNYFSNTTSQLSDVIGAMINDDVSKGEPLTKDNVLKPGEHGFLAAVISPGKRAISIDVSAASANSGLISPGDRVDVLYAKRLNASEEEGSNESETIVSNVRVLASDTMLSGVGDQKPVPKTVTLEVSPVQAEIIIGAIQNGSISLSLRSINNDKQEEECSDGNCDDEAQRSVTVIRGNQKTNVSVRGNK